MAGARDEKAVPLQVFLGTDLLTLTKDAMKLCEDARDTLAKIKDTKDESEKNSLKTAALMLYQDALKLDDENWEAQKELMVLNDSFKQMSPEEFKSKMDKIKEQKEMWKTALGDFPTDLFFG